MNICIVIPSYNLVDKLTRCLDHILDTGYQNIDLIIFDNGSSPPLKESLRSYRDKIKGLSFLRSEKNIGFARANNKSLEFAVKRLKKIDYFLLLNNDAYINKDFFDISLNYLKHKYALLSPFVLLTKNRGFDSKGISYYRDGTGVNRTGNKDHAILLPAACMFVSNKYVKESFHNYGWLFNPYFGSYAEDIELSLRTTLIGKRTGLIPHNLVYHDRSSTLDKSGIDFLSTRNQLWTIITTWTSNMIKKNISEIINGQVNNAFIAILKFRIIFMLRIYIQTLFFLPELLKIRKLIQKSILLRDRDDIFSEKMPTTFTTLIKQSRTYKKLLKFFT